MVVYVTFLRDVACQKLLNSANVSRSYSQNNTGTVFFETRCIGVDLRLFPSAFHCACKYVQCEILDWFRTTFVSQISCRVSPTALTGTDG